MKRSIYVVKTSLLSAYFSWFEIALMGFHTYYFFTLLLDIPIDSLFETSKHVHHINEIEHIFFSTKWLKFSPKTNIC